MKVKLFTKKNPTGRKGRNREELEHEINAWLEQNASVSVREIRQSSSGGSFVPSELFISVWYEQGA